MKPVLFVIPLPWVGPLAIKAYGVMLMLAFLFGLWLALWRARKEKVDPNIVWDFWVYALIGGVVGARALYIIENYGQFAGRWADIFKIWEGGLSFYGGFLIAALSTAVMLRVRRVPILKIYDIMAVSSILGLAFGKIGCFLNGCCFGRLTDSFVGVTYPATAPIDGLGTLRESPAFAWQVAHGLVGPTALRSLPVQPVQLYEAAGALCIMAILLLFYRHRSRYGEVAILFGTLYPVMRFFFEFLREPESPLILGLTTYQILSVVAFAIFATIFIVSRKSKPVLAV